MSVVHYVALALFTVLMLALARIKRVREIHHGYVGVALVLAQLVFGWPEWVAWVGVVFLADDAVQHVSEALGFVPRMADWTPIHRLGAWALGLFQRSVA